MKTCLDWSAYDTYGIGDAYSGIPARGGNYAKAVAVCMHSHECYKTGKGVMCPSFRVTRNIGDTPEARVAAFKAALNGEYGEKPFEDQRLAAPIGLRNRSRLLAQLAETLFGIAADAPVPQLRNGLSRRHSGAGCAAR